MTDAEILKAVKTGLNITGTYQDDTLMIYIDDVKYYMSDAGVSQDLINSNASVGVIVRGVSDLWNYGMGNADFSEYFRQRVIQLRYKNKLEELGELTVSSTAGGTFGTTHIDITGQSTNAIFKIKLSPSNIDLPTYDESLDDWTDWDGKSDIEGEDGYKIYIAEVTTENLARKIGTTIITVNLG